MSARNFYPGRLPYEQAEARIAGGRPGERIPLPEGRRGRAGEVWSLARLYAESREITIEPHGQGFVAVVQERF